jgi:hypothetical protein
MKSVLEVSIVALYAADPCLVTATPNALKLEIEQTTPKHIPRITPSLSKSIFLKALKVSSIG